MVICKIGELKSQNIKMEVSKGSVKFEYPGWGYIKISLLNLDGDVNIVAYGEDIIDSIKNFDVTKEEKEEMKNIYLWLRGELPQMFESVCSIEIYDNKKIFGSYLIIGPNGQIMIKKRCGYIPAIFYPIKIERGIGAIYKFRRGIHYHLFKYNNGYLEKEYLSSKKIRECLEILYDYILEGNITKKLKYVKAKCLVAIFIEDITTIEEFERKLEEVVKEIEIKEELQKLKNRVLELEEEVKKLKDENDNLKNKLEDVRREKDIEINKIKKEMIGKIIENIWKKYYTGIFRKVGGREFKIKSYKQLKKAIELMLKELEE